MKRRAFKFYEEWAQTLLNLPKEARHELTDAILSYYITKVNPSFENPLLQGFFKMFQVVMDEDERLYDKKCLTNSNNRKGKSRPITTDNDGERPITTDNDGDQLINKSINKLINKQSDVNITLSRHPSKIEALQRQFKLSKEQLHEWGCRFNDFISIEGKVHKDEQDQHAHFRDWLNKNLEKQKKSVSGNNDANEAIHRQIMEEQRQERAKRSEGCISYEEYQKTKQQTSCS